MDELHMDNTLVCAQPYCIFLHNLKTSKLTREVNISSLTRSTCSSVSLDHNKSNYQKHIVFRPMGQPTSFWHLTRGVHNDNFCGLGCGHHGHPLAALVASA
ncbi:hypothetical protein VPH35_112220 [Triticum aestivum]